MTVYHMSKDGSPKVCKALKGTCPLGGEHFNSLPEAKAFIELQLAKELGAFNPAEMGETFTVAQRRRMWQQNPKMSYIHPLGTLLISKRGDLWELVKRESLGGPFEHKFLLQNTRSGKTVTVNTAFERGEKEKSPEDFAQLTPKHFKVDGPPLRAGNKLVTLPNGRLKLHNAFITKIRIETVENALDKEKPQFYNEFGERSTAEEFRVYGRRLQEPKYRYLIVPDSERDMDNVDYRDEILRALWAQAGRDEKSWDALSSHEKNALFNDSKLVREAIFSTKNGSTTFTNGDLASNQFDSFWLPGGTPTSSISLYDKNG